MKGFKKITESFSVRLALRFMFLLTTSIILLTLAFLFFTRSLVIAGQTEELKKAEAAVYDEMQNADNYMTPSIPYYLTYIVWDYDSQDVISTNDPFLPLLEQTNGKSVHYFEKDFFFDGDLDIMYYAQEHRFLGRKVIVAVAMNMDNSSTAMIFSKLPLALLFLSLPILFLSFFVCLFITKNTISPVVKITKTAQSMSTQNLDTLLPLTNRNDEIDELSKTFNDLFIRIKADFDRERQFSSDVSHELNTPLTVILGQANLLLRWGKDDPKQLEKSLNAIKNESNSMHAIIENLMQISRIESGRIKPELSEVNVGELFERVTQEFTSVAPEVQFKCNSGDIKLNTDNEMLHQILTVLVSNSIKFSKKENAAAGTADTQKCIIQLNAWEQDKTIYIQESDNGPGIKEKDLTHIFERFYRSDEAHTRAAGGSGLGLAIARTLCQSLGAEISAGNIEPNGAVFTICFPA